MPAPSPTTTVPPTPSVPRIPSHPPTDGPIRVLALDGAPGGAVRGYAQIKIVRALMQMIWEKNHPHQRVVEAEVDAMRPCDHFNMIFGSGTGGAIAVYLGRLNLTIKECEEHYERLGDEVYAHPCSIWNPFHRFNYDFERLERLLKEQTKPFHRVNSDTLDFGHHRKNSPECKAAVLTKMVHNTQAVHLIKSYDVESGQVWEAIRATTAAYYDFPNVTVGRLKLIAPDAGFSNPSGKAWIEATTLYPHQAYGTNRGIWFVSIGSGVELPNDLRLPSPNWLEKRIHSGLIATRRSLVKTRRSVEGVLPDEAKRVITAIRQGATTVQNWAGYGWEFAQGSLPGRSERLRMLATEIHTRDTEMRNRFRRPFVEGDLGKLHYYRLDLKLEQAHFEYDAWKHHQGLLKPIFSRKNPALLPEGPLLHAINTACKVLVKPPNNGAAQPVRILTLDGSPGALSALVQLRLIRELMGSIWKQERLQSGRPANPLKGDIDNMRPAEYFDLIVGSGTGGAIAIYLCWFRFTVQECEAHFHGIGDTVYAAPFSRWSVWQRYNYDQKSLERLLQDQSRSCDLDTPQHNTAPGFARKSQLKFCYQPSGDSRCKVAVFASKYPSRSADILRSYGEDGVDSAHDADVWQAIQATMAAHGDFPPVRIGDVSLLGSEAGWSNPAIAAINEAQRLFGQEKETCFISIGTGLQPPRSPEDSDPIETRIRDGIMKTRTVFWNLWAAAWGKLPAKAHPLRDLAIGCQNEHHKMLDHMRPRDLRHYFDPDTSKYFRFNVEDVDLLSATVWNQANKNLVEEWASNLGSDTDQSRFGKLQDAAEQL